MTPRTVIQWPGLIRIGAFVSIIMIAMIIAYECGKYHRNPEAFMEAFYLRIAG